MISYILDFSTTNDRITVRKQDDGTYVVEKHKCGVILIVSTCSEFVDAVSVFKGHACEMMDDILTQEIGND